MSVLQRVISACTVGYAFCFLVWRLLVASPFFERWWPLQLSEVFGVWACAPLPLLLVACLVWRNRWSTFALIVPLLWFVVEYGSLFVPEMTTSVRASAEVPTLRVMTFNTWKEFRSRAEFVASVEEWQPDLIAMQEVHSVLRRDLESLSTTWPYQVVDVIRSSSRIALLSKYPIEKVKVDESTLGCHCMQALVRWQDRTVRVIVVHIRAPSLGARNFKGSPLRVVGFDTSLQERSLQQVIDIVEASQEPVIVLGDFNTTERQVGYKALLAAGLSNAHAEAGWGLGFTYPAPATRLSWLFFPVIRIDHVFYDHSWRALETWTASLMGSDHLALVADLEWIGDD